MKPRLLLPKPANVDPLFLAPIHSKPIHHTEIDPWELHLFLDELRDWVLSGEHHMHKISQFQTCQKALEWLTLAQALSGRHGRNCLFYLGRVGSGRIDTDILNRIDGRLTRDDLDVAKMLNALEREIKCKSRHNWLASHQPDFNRLELAASLRLGGLLDQGVVQA